MNEVASPENVVGENLRSQVRLLEDVPASKDEFSGKAHERVAEAIADLVTQERGGRVIGLRGTWGSGKSTIVSLVKGRLEGSKPEGARTFVFDAWAHQGDPLRRTFLESLLTQLHGWGWVGNKFDIDTRSEFTGRRTDEETRTTSTLSREGKWVAVSSLLVPLGAALVLNVFHRDHAIGIYVGIGLTLLPALVVLGFDGPLLIERLMRTIRRKPDKEEHDKRRAFDFFERDQNTVTKTKGVERGEPTSVEFEKYFKDILNEGVKEGRRLLVVLDNLDRVSREDGRRVLSTMQTFTGTSGADRVGPWSDRVWTLIPYDGEGLERLWNDASTVSTADESEDESDSSGLESSATVANAFFDKLFAVRFDAPPLLLVDWRKHLAELLKTALPEVDDTEIASVVRLRALYVATNPQSTVSAEPPTPRQLKQFVNQIGSLVRQHPELPLGHIAYFVLLERDGKEIEGELLRGTVPNPTMRERLGERVAEDLAALRFGTDPALATQVLLGGPLMRAIDAGDAEAVKELSQRPGFVDFFDTLNVYPWMESGAVEYSKNMITLDESGVLADSRLSAWIQSELLTAARTSSGWALPDERTGSGLAVLCELLASDERVAVVFDRLDDIAIVPAPEPDAALRGLASLCDSLFKRKIPLDAINVDVSVDATLLLPALAAFASRGSHAWAAVHIGLDNTAVTAAIVTSATTKDASQVLSAIRVLLVHPNQFDAKSVVSAISNKLESNDLPDPNQLEPMLAILDLLAGKERAVLIGPLAADGTLMHHFNQSIVNSRFTSAAAASMMYLEVRPSNLDPVVNNPQVNQEAIAGITALRQSLMNVTSSPNLIAAQGEWLTSRKTRAFDLIVARFTDDPTIEPWASEQLRRLLDAGKLTPGADEVVKNIDVLRRLLGDDGFATFLGTQLKSASRRSELVQITGDPELVRTALAVTRSDADARADVVTWAKKQVSNASEAEWMSCLDSTDGGALLSLALELGPEETASPALCEAILSHAVKLADGESVWSPETSTFEQLVDLMDGPARSSLASQIAAKLEPREEVSVTFFDVYGTFLSKEPKFRTHPNLPNALWRLLVHDNWAGVEWFTELAQEHDDTFASPESKDSLENLKNVTVEKLRSMGAEAPGALVALADYFGVNAEPPTGDDESQADTTDDD